MPTLNNLLMDAHVACGGTRNEVTGFILRKIENDTETHGVFDTLAADGTECIFKGTKKECLSFVLGITWGAKAGRSAFAAQF